MSRVNARKEAIDFAVAEAYRVARLYINAAADGLKPTDVCVRHIEGAIERMRDDIKRIRSLDWRPREDV